MSEQSYNLVTDKVMSPTEAAYVAGFVDGEGTITIGRQRRDENRAGFRYIPILIAANTDLAGLEAVRRMCGNGRVSLCTPSKRQAHKHLFRLTMAANQIRRVLPQIRPFLVIKAKQADLLTEFLDLIVSGRNCSPEDWQRQEDLRAEIRSMNHRGLTEARQPRELVMVRKTKPQPKREPKPCQVDGCERPHSAHGYCHPHYKLYVLRGGPSKYEASCEHCGARFISHYKGTRFCSKSCNDKRHRVRNRKT